MYQYLHIISLMVVLHTASIEAANTYSNNQNFQLPIRVYPTQEQQAPTLQQQEQYIPYRPLRRGYNGYGLQNSYNYQTLGYNNVQPTGGISFTQSQSQLPPEQVFRQQQQQIFPFLINRPSTGDRSLVQYNPALNVDSQYPSTGYLRNNDHQRTSFRYTPQYPERNNFRYTPQSQDENYYGQNQVSLPSSRESALLFDRNSVVPLQSNHLSPSTDYAKLFERYLRKYPERLQPTYIDNGYGK